MSHHSAFNQDSSASAARVIHCMIMPKPRKRAKCGGKSFSYRCVISFGTISSFMKSPSGSIKHNCHFVFHNRKLNLMNRTGFLKPRYAIILFKRLNYCFFYYLLAIGNGMKSRINAVTLNGKCIAWADKFRPRKRFHRLKKLFKRFSLKPIKNNKNSFCKAAVNISSCKHSLIALKKDTSVFGWYVFSLHKFKFICNQAF